MSVHVCGGPSDGVSTTVGGGDVGTTDGSGDVGNEGEGLALGMGGTVLALDRTDGFVVSVSESMLELRWKVVSVHVCGGRTDGVGTIVGAGDVGNEGE